MAVQSNNIFTLVEVLIALVVLSAGILTGTALLGSAKKRSMDAERQWEEQHAITQAAEYFLLAGKNGGKIPERFFPFREYKIEVLYEFPVGLPFDIPTQRSGWELVTMQLNLLDRNRDVIRELSIDRMILSEEK